MRVASGSGHGTKEIWLIFDVEDCGPLDPWDL